MPRPHQPRLLQLLHGLTALLVPLAWLSGLVVLSQNDGRWGRLPFTLPGDWVDVHGSFGALLWPVALLFGVYALGPGRWRLSRWGNALPLLALVLAVGSGKAMQEDWLRQGQLDQLVYQLHLLAWLLLAVAVLVHLLTLLRRGGWPLLHSMLPR
ncbi:MAG: cytochrome b/b6 domain-containing protein [Vulcanococcus sp.]